MKYLKPEQIIELSASIMNSIGYAYAIRKIFLSEIPKEFTNLLHDANFNEKTQLDLDFIRLNETERLTDGSIPFQSWLNRATPYTQPFKAANKIVQEALAIIENTAFKSKPVADIASPSDAVVEKIIQEKIVNQNDMLSFSFLEAGVRAGSGIVRLRVPKYENGIPAQNMGFPVNFSGTGWLLTRQLLITNHHVVNARGDDEDDALEADLLLQGGNSIVDFDYNSDNMEPVSVAVNELVAFDDELDFAILRLKMPVSRNPSARYPHEIQLQADNPQAVNIIQHPFGHSKKIAFRNNHIYKTEFPLLYYFTDTEKGSSGSAVFNDNWQVVALHRASKLVQDVSYQGKNTSWINEGVQLKAIFDFLKTNHKPISDEILNG